MRLYRLDKRHEAGTSAGFEFFERHRDAVDALADYLNGFTPDDMAAGTIEPIDVSPTRAGLLRALNRYASHPDNG